MLINAICNITLFYTGIIIMPVTQKTVITTDRLGISADVMPKPIWYIVDLY